MDGPLNVISPVIHSTASDGQQIDLLDNLASNIRSRMSDVECIYDEAAFEDAHSLPHHNVPLKLGTEENLKGYGNIVYDFHAEKVEIKPWPQTGKRAVSVGTGLGAGTIEGDFLFRYERTVLIADNLAAGEIGMNFVTGRFDQGENDITEATHILVRDSNYHPDGGQVFYPKTKKPFIMLLSKAGDDITLDDYEAFYFDGSCGFNIAPGVWHQSPYPTEDQNMAFYNKQGAVFACVMMDTVREFNTYLRVPLHL